MQFGPAELQWYIMHVERQCIRQVYQRDRKSMLSKMGAKIIDIDHHFDCNSLSERERVC